ncbi:SMG1 [Cordylochernes scorpioides]|uniref:SMG1 n=1 Tax=Cordylochernes scorpioides TaxID=51811 RepID=A0ABY6K2F9_9ARAC|nr:SMG1 [Cordylochernes scorpioides]
MKIVEGQGLVVELKFCLKMCHHNRPSCVCGLPIRMRLLDRVYARFWVVLVASSQPPKTGDQTFAGTFEKSLKLEEDKDMQQHITTMMELVDKLRTIGETLKDSHITAILLCSLPKSYSNLITVLESRPDDELTLEFTKNKLLDEHTRRVESSKDESTASKALKSLHSASSQRREKEKKFCSFCHKPNHSKEECWHYQKRNNSNKEYKYENFRRGNVPKYTNQSSVTQEESTNQRTTKGPNPKALNCTQREASVHNWFVDSKATSHMAYDESFFTELNREQTQNVVVANGNKLQVRGIGQGEIKVITPQGKTDTLLLTKVLYIPELTDNLLSVSAATSNGCKVTFNRDWCTIERDNTALANGILDNGMYRLHLDDNPQTRTFKANVAKQNHCKNKNCLMLWHDRLGHRNIESIKKIRNENLARGLSLNNCSHSTDCVQCIQGKLTETPFPKKTEYRATETLQLVHSDICGPLPTNSLSVEDFLNQSGIKHQLTVPYSPAQNGVAERKNRSLMEMTRCMLFDSGLPQSLWAEAVTTANYLHNRIPSKATDKTPFELWTNRKPSLKHLKRFGCKAFAYIPKIKRNKLDRKVIEGIFLGYDDRSKGYRILHDTDNITISRSVKFIEKENGFHHASTKTTSPQVLSTDLTSSNHIGNAEESQEPGTQSENLEDSETEDYLQPGTSTGTQVVTQRKSTRPTKGIPPIRNDYMLYKTEAQDIQTPTSYSEVLQLPKIERDKWLQAMNEELNSLEKNYVWELTPLPKDKKIIGCKWTYKQKLNSKGEIERYKARLLAKGFNQKFGRDYEETFAPIVKHSTIRAFLAASVYKGMKVIHLDVKTAFLHGDLDKELYMELPEGLHTKQTNEVCKLKKAICDIAAPVCILSSRNQNPRNCDWNAAKRIVRYLKTTKELELRISNQKPPTLEAYSDATWASDNTDRKSLSGNLFLLGSNPISWMTGKQGCVSLSSTEAELISAAEASQELLWLLDLLKDLELEQKAPIYFHQDNQSCLKICSSEKVSSRTKHIATKIHHLKDLQKKTVIKMVYCPTGDMKADILTKPLPRPTFEKLRYNLVIIRKFWELEDVPISKAQLGIKNAPSPSLPDSVQGSPSLTLSLQSSKHNSPTPLQISVHSLKEAMSPLVEMPSSPGCSKQIPIPIEEDSTEANFAREYSQRSPIPDQESDPLGLNKEEGAWQTKVAGFLRSPQSCSSSVSTTICGEMDPEDSCHTIICEAPVTFPNQEEVTQSTSTTQSGTWPPVEDPQALYPSYTLSSASVEDFKAQSGPKSPTSPTRGSESCRCSGDYTEPQMSQNSNFSCSSIEESEDNSSKSEENLSRSEDNPNTQGLLRVGGRLKYSYLNENQKFPLLQPKSPRQESLIKNLLTENADIPEAIDENQEDSSILETTFVIEDEESNKDIGTPKIEISEVSVIDKSEGKYSKEPVVSVEALDKKELCHDDSAHLNVVEADLNRPKEATSGIINVYTEASESSSKEKVVPVEIVDTSTKDYLQSGEKAKLSRWKPIDSLCLEDVKESEDDDENYSSSAYIEWPEILKKEVLRPEALEKAVNLEDFEKAARGVIAAAEVHSEITDETRFVRLLNRLERDDERERPFSTLRQIKDILSQPENAKALSDFETDQLEELSHQGDGLESHSWSGLANVEELKILHLSAASLLRDPLSTFVDTKDMVEGLQGVTSILQKSLRMGSEEWPPVLDSQQATFFQAASTLATGLSQGQKIEPFHLRAPLTLPAVDSNFSVLQHALLWTSIWQRVTNHPAPELRSELQLSVARLARKQHNFRLARRLLLSMGEGEDLPQSLQATIVQQPCEQLAALHREGAKLLQNCGETGAAVELLVNSVAKLMKEPSLGGPAARALLTLSRYLQQDASTNHLDALSALTPQLQSPSLPSGLPDSEQILGQILHTATSQAPSLAKPWLALAAWSYRWGHKAADSPLEVSPNLQAELLSLVKRDLSEGEQKELLEAVGRGGEGPGWLEPDLEPLVQELRSRAVEQAFQLYQIAARSYFTFLQCAEGPAGEEDNVTATLRLLRLVVKHASELRTTLEEGLAHTPTGPWRGIIPQLVSRLNHPETYVRQSISELLCRVAQDSPHLILFPAVVGSLSSGPRATGTGLLKTYLEEGGSSPQSEEEEEAAERGRQAAAMQDHLTALVDTLARRDSGTIAQVQVLVSELRRVTVLWDELWLGTLTLHHSDTSRRIHTLEEEIRKVQSNESLSPEERAQLITDKHYVFVRPLVFLLEQLHTITSQKPETPHEVWFQETFGQIIEETLEGIRSPSNPAKPQQAWHLYKQLHQRLQQGCGGSSRSQLVLADLSPTLAQLRSTQIPMPGCVRPHVTVQALLPHLSVLPTKTKPKKLAMTGSDGHKYTYLFKGLEDLHLDERIMQFLAIVNTMLDKHNRKQGKDIPYRARHYSVTPLGPRSGLIQWVDRATPLFGLYKRWQQREALAKSTPAAPVPRPSELYYNKLTPLLKEKGVTNMENRKEWPLSVQLQVLKELMEQTPRDLLAKELWCSSTSGPEWWNMTQTYSRSTAVLSIVGYIIGLGDRHLDNVLVDLSTGENVSAFVIKTGSTTQWQDDLAPKEMAASDMRNRRHVQLLLTWSTDAAHSVIHIDYNVCFEKGKNLRVPEKVPFRMTPNIETALGLTGVEGIFRVSCETVLKVMRRGRETLLTLLEAFVYDPLVEWTTAGGETGFTGAIYGGTGGPLLPRQTMESQVVFRLFGVRLAEMRAAWLKSKQEMESTLEQLRMEMELWVGAQASLQAAERELQEVCHQRTLIDEALANPHHSLYTLPARYKEYAAVKTALLNCEQAVREKLAECTKWQASHEDALAAVCGPQLGEWLQQSVPQPLPQSCTISPAVDFLNSSGKPQLVQQCEAAEVDLNNTLHELHVAISTCVETLSNYAIIVMQFPATFRKQNRSVSWQHLLSSLLEDFTHAKCVEAETRLQQCGPEPPSLNAVHAAFAVYVSLKNYIADMNNKLLATLEFQHHEGIPDISVVTSVTSDTRSNLSHFIQVHVVQAMIIMIAPAEIEFNDEG